MDKKTIFSMYCLNHAFLSNNVSSTHMNNMDILKEYLNKYNNEKKKKKKISQTVKQEFMKFLKFLKNQFF